MCHGYIRGYPVFRKYTLKYLGVKSHDACNLLLDDSGKKMLCVHVYHTHAHTCIQGEKERGIERMSANIKVRICGYSLYYFKFCNFLEI